MLLDAPCRSLLLHVLQNIPRAHRFCGEDPTNLCSRSEYADTVVQILQGNTWKWHNGSDFTLRDSDFESRADSRGIFAVDGLFVFSTVETLYLLALF